MSYNLFQLSRLRMLDFHGIDADLVTSLAEYGMAWRQVPRDTGSWHKGDWQFVFRCDYHPDGTPYFDCNTYSDAINWRLEWDWIGEKEAALLDFLGMTKEEFDKQPFPIQVYDLVSYFGAEEIFGTSYNPTMIKGVI